MFDTFCFGVDNNSLRSSCFKKVASCGVSFQEDFPFAFFLLVSSNNLLLGSSITKSGLHRGPNTRYILYNEQLKSIN